VNYWDTSCLLRSLDGIHLATALSLKATGLLTADTRLRDAALFCGLATSG
jgi:predicted nucleic acid-binding protein